MNWRSNGFGLCVGLLMVLVAGLSPIACTTPRYAWVVQTLDGDAQVRYCAVGPVWYNNDGAGVHFTEGSTGETVILTGGTIRVKWLPKGSRGCA